MASPTDKRWRGRRGRRRSSARLAYRNLALRLSADLAEAVGARSLLITSPTAARECLVATRELARFLAEERGASVLLMDAGFIRPALSASLGAAGVPGLSELITGALETEGSIDDLVRPTSQPGVSLLAAGTQGSDASALKHAARAKELMGEASRGFDYAILHAPPVLEDASGLIFPAAVNCSLLLAVEGLTRVADVDAARDVLESSGASRVRLVLTSRVRRGLFGWRGLGRS